MIHSILHILKRTKGNNNMITCRNLKKGNFQFDCLFKGYDYGNETL